MDTDLFLIFRSIWRVQMRRYQIFVSSTFLDLKEERAAVLESILQMKCFPAGMELFPSASMNQFEYIKKVIDDSDYYILVIGGRYGDAPTGELSYTEQEFDYAKSNNIPILAFLCESPEDRPAKFYELDPVKREKLQAFREKAQAGRLTKYWSTPDELAKKVLIGLQEAINLTPRLGWEKALPISNVDLHHNLQKLQNELTITKQMLVEAESRIMAQETDFWSKHICLMGTLEQENQIRIPYECDVSIRYIFNLWYPHLLKVSLDVEARDNLNRMIEQNQNLYLFKMDDDCYTLIKTLLVEAGIIAEFVSRRSYGGIISNIVLTKKGKQTWDSLNQ